MSKLQLLTKDLILRTVVAHDIDEVSRTWATPDRLTRQQAHDIFKYMENTRRLNKEKEIYHLCLAVFRKKDPQKIIGWCGLDGKTDTDQTSIFYRIEEKQRNKGYATQCAQELLKYAFIDMDYDVITGACVDTNIASYKVMMNAGMRQVGETDEGNYLFEINRKDFFGEDDPNREED